MLSRKGKSKPKLKEATDIYLKIGVLSFGGPAAQIALMHRYFVIENKWLNEKEFLNALGFCMLLPGPEAMQLATFVGWKLHGIIGGLVAGLFFVIPGAIVIFLLALLYVYFGEMEWMRAAFLGVKSAVLVIVIEALLRVSKRALTDHTHWLIAVLAFVAIFFFEIPYPFIIAAVGLFGICLSNRAPITTNKKPPSISFSATLKTIITWLGLWFAPIFVIGIATNWGFLFELGMFFSKVASVTFGGAYAVLAFMSQDIVFSHGWLTTEQMMDGLGLAETTPGPLILVTEFVGFVAGFQESGLVTAILSTVVVLWVTFVPCFLWIFAGAPYVEWIADQPRLNSALSAVTAAVVGVILSLSIWFGLHVLFEEIEKLQFGFLHIWAPNFATLNPLAAALAALSFYLLILRHTNIIVTLIICASLAVVFSLIYQF